MNLDLNVFSSSNAERFGDESFETEGTFDTNTFSSDSTTRYEADEVGVGIFDDTFDFTFE